MRVYPDKPLSSLAAKAITLPAESYWKSSEAQYIFLPTDDDFDMMQPIKT
jgi:hypothetical protein